MEPKTLDITEVKGAKANISDLKVWGNGDTFKLICKASSEEQGWMKSTKAMEIQGVGCVVQVTTQQRNQDGSYAVAEALAFVPGVEIVEFTAPEDVDKEDAPVTARMLRTTAISLVQRCQASALPVAADAEVVA